jgi:hypothetical protein
MSVPTSNTLCFLATEKVAPALLDKCLLILNVFPELCSTKARCGP